MSVILTSVSFVRSLVVLDGRAASVLEIALGGHQADGNQGFDDSNSEPYSIESPRDDIHQNHRTAYDFDDSIENEFAHFSNLYSQHHLLLLTDLDLDDYNCVVEI
ncbi:hypothetical protein DYB37_011110 [Aphanomyces astaci]|uniref:Uncharacterized protein n=1 Tax=Aphanomyces astaci TaxID=112090 RepID=A0A3R6XJM8_APHAT|nr:hypothetical protein DYB35_012576 [Aphanomyces astaci]RHZ19045.1 hypothetical protein DYB37_011110 [Aphanomyces astaci]